MQLMILGGIFMFILGTVFGSFYNVVSYRLPLNLSIVFPPSHCTKCKNRLKPLELIPILSFLFQKGKCKHCKSKISVMYPIFELLTGILFFLSFWIFYPNNTMYISLIFVSLLVIVINSDIHHMIIPDEPLILSSILAIIVRLFLQGDKILYIFYDFAFPFIAMLLIKLLGDFIFKKESLGGGDIKLMGVIGLCLGWELSIFSIFLGSFIALPISLVILFVNKKRELPFGPYLSIAALILLFLQIDINNLLYFLL